MLAIVAIALALPASASANLGTAAQPWVYIVPGVFSVPQGDSIEVNLNNESNSAQTFLAPGIEPNGTFTPTTVAANTGASIGGACVSGSGCQEQLVLDVSSPDVVPSLIATMATGTGNNTFPILIGPGQFGLIGPNGVANDVLGSLAGSAASFQGLLGSTSSQVAGIASSVGAGAGASTTDARLAALQGQVSTLTTDVTKLTALVKRLEPKPKPKPKKKKTRR